MEEGIQDQRVLEAMSCIPRHQFIDEENWDDAYVNRPIPIDEGQTVSQPYMVALMSESLGLRKTDHVLEIGTGSGYQTAILADLTERVFTVERYSTLSKSARKRLTDLGFMNVEYRVGDGTLGWPEKNQFDVIIATGAAPEIPQSLVSQLKVQGRMVIPVGNRQVQKLLLVRKEEDRIRKRELCYCSFLPLLGKEGWPGREKTHNG